LLSTSSSAISPFDIPLATTLAATGSSLGLRGMRDQIEGLGGSFTAGPDVGGGFSLCARVRLSAHVPQELAAAS
jgi:hypothetical protein